MMTITSRPRSAAPPPTLLSAPFDEADIRRVLDGDAITMAFQPVVDIRTGRTVGTEALARFVSTPYRTPDLWFAEAERCGLGLRLELAAVRSAVGRIPELPADVYVAVNVSPRALVSDALLEILAVVPGDRVVIELTEHARVDSYGTLQQVVALYRSRGFRLAIDDAGSGYSSFQHILELRPDLIKLDRGLTAGVDKNPVRFALASALVTFAASLGARICAEGIETSGELVSLQQLGVQLGQGYFLGRPAPLPLQPAPRGVWFVPSAPDEPSPAAHVPSPAVRSPKRLAALRATGLMDSAPEEEFDRFTRLAARLLDVPVALLALVDDQRQFFKSATGLDVRGTPLSNSFCAHVVTAGAPLVVSDSSKNPLVASNPVIEQLGVVAYAGMPIIGSDGEALGSFCAVDGTPRVWSEAELITLRDLAAMATDHIDLRRSLKGSQERADLSDHLLRHTDAGILVLDLQFTIERANPAICAFLGRAEETLVGKPFDILKEPEDLAQSFVARDELLSGGVSEVLACARLVNADGKALWFTIEARLVRDVAGIPHSFVFTVTPAGPGAA